MGIGGHMNNSRWRKMKWAGARLYSIYDTQYMGTVLSRLQRGLKIPVSLVNPSNTLHLCMNSFILADFTNCFHNSAGNRILDEINYIYFNINELFSFSKLGHGSADAWYWGRYSTQAV